MPGLEFNEVESRQVQNAVGTNTVCTFVGQTKRGSSAKPQLVSSWKDYERRFGGLGENNDLGVSLHRFYSSGGQYARVLRILGDDAAGASSTVAARSGGTAFTAYASSEGAWGNDINLNFALRELVTSVAPTNVEPRGGGEAEDRFMWFTVPRLTGIVAGDVFDVYVTATGAYRGPGLVVGLDPASSKICMYDLGNNFPADAALTLRSNSRHRAQTRLALDLVANTPVNTLDLASTDGIDVGSLLTLQLAAICDTEEDAPVAENQYRQAAVVVRSVAGRRVTLEEAFNPGVAAWPAEVAARLYAPVTVRSYLKLVAKTPGTAGNRISLTVTLGAPATAVSVSGTAIRVALAVGGTIEALRSALAADAQASALVTATTLIAAPDTNASAVASPVPTVLLTGGAATTVVSQEFGFKVESGNTELEAGRFDFLSTVPTSPKYFNKHFGGSISPLASDDSNRSLVLILRAIDDDIESGSEELLGMPRASNVTPLTSGADGYAPTEEQYIGQAEPRSGLYLLDNVVDSSILLIPGVTSSAVQRAVVEYVEGRGDMVAFLDMPSTLSTAAALSNYREFELGLSSSFVQFFAPFGKIRDPRRQVSSNAILEVPPSPEVAAAAVRAAQGGSHKSIGNQQVAWITPSVLFQKAEYNSLNDQGINLVVANPTLGVIIGGDRTQALDTENPRRWGSNRRYLLNLRRRLEAALAKRTFMAITRTELNAVRNDVETVLSSDFQAGALYGDSEEQAFRVRCDFETTTTDDIRNATIGVEIVLVLAALAEVIRFNIDTRSGGVSSITEG